MFCFLHMWYVQIPEGFKSPQTSTPQTQPDVPKAKTSKRLVLTVVQVLDVSSVLRCSTESLRVLCDAHHLTVLELGGAGRLAGRLCALASTVVHLAAAMSAEAEEQEEEASGEYSAVIFFGRIVVVSMETNFRFDRNTKNLKAK